MPTGGSVPTVPGEPVALGFSNLTGSFGDHIGHFFQVEEERRAVLEPFISAGLAAGHKCIYICGPDHPGQAIQDCLDERGIDVADVLASGQLVLADGRQRPEDMGALLAETLESARGRFSAVRWSADMTWSLSKMPTSRTLMEWESCCNVIESAPIIFLCQYKLARFRGDVVMDALKTHPLCIVGKAIHRNPMYMEPETFLQELGHREDPR